MRLLAKDKIREVAKEELKKRDKKHLTKTEKKKPSSDLSDDEDESEN